MDKHTFTLLTLLIERTLLLLVFIAVSVLLLFGLSETVALINLLYEALSS